jgi:hypothetical protein
MWGVPHMSGHNTSRAKHLFTQASLVHAAPFRGFLTFATGALAIDAARSGATRICLGGTAAFAPKVFLQVFVDFLIPILQRPVLHYMLFSALLNIQAY